MRYEATTHRRYEVEGEPFVYGARSAALVALDGVSGEVLEHFAAPGGAELDAWQASNVARADAAERREALEELVALGLLAPTGAELPAADALPPQPFPLSTLVLNVSNKCNLSCTYCYEYGEDRIRSDAVARKPRMDAKTAFAAIDMLFESAGARPEVSLTFFGGETLLNFETIREAV